MTGGAAGLQHALRTSALLGEDLSHPLTPGNDSSAPNLPLPLKKPPHISTVLWIPSLPVSTCVHESREGDKKKKNPQILSMKYQHPVSWRVLRHTGKITGAEMRLHVDARRMFGLFTTSARTHLHVHVQRGEDFFLLRSEEPQRDQLFSALHPRKSKRVRKEMNSCVLAGRRVGDTSSGGGE